MIMKFLVKLVLIILVFKMSSAAASDQLPEVEWKQLAKLKLDVDTIPEDVHKVLKRISITGYMLKKEKEAKSEMIDSFVLAAASELQENMTLPGKNQIVRVTLSEAVKTSSLLGELTLNGELSAEYSKNKMEWSYVLTDATVSQKADLVKAK